MSALSTSCILVAEPVVKRSLGLQVQVAEGTKSDWESSKGGLKLTETRGGAFTYTFIKSWISGFHSKLKKKKLSTNRKC